MTHACLQVDQIQLLETAKDDLASTKSAVGYLEI